MSSFDDEFGLFGEDDVQAERRSTLGARNIASDETAIDDIEPEDETPGRRSRGETGIPKPLRRPRAQSVRRDRADPAAAQKRAGELLAFLAKKLVSKADAVTVESFPPENGEEASIELVVDPEDLGKVIGRSGRVAQALRTIVRATAEGRLSVEIFDTDESFEEEDDEAEDQARPD